MELSRGRPIFDRQIMPLFAIFLVASLNWIPKGACEVEARMESQFERCCGLGTSWASEGLRCEKFTGPVSGVPRVEQGLCLEAVDICCVRAYHEKSCEKGKEDARAGKACVQGEKPRNSPCPGEQQRDCCEGCKLGILTGSMGQGCAFKSFSFGKPWDPAFLECCHEASPTTTNTDTDSTPTFSTDTTMNASETSDPSSPSTSSTSESDETSPDIPTPALDDICELMKGLLCSDICVPTPGSFYCKCSEGSILLEDGKTCRSNSPEDRCKTKNPCAQRCKDTGSEVICSCNPGFILAEDGHACSPVSSRLGEASDEDNDLDDPRCPAGYKYNKTGQVCDDIDECENNPCPGSCKNLVGTFLCLPGSADNDKESHQESCPPGYQWDPQVQRCTDIDECIVLDGACSQDTHLCVNTQGSFTCHELNGPKACPAGFKFDVAAKICKDVDECAEGIHGCLPGVEECRNTEGAYECDIKCRKGFSYSQRLDICVDVNECTETLHPCPDPKTHCVNIVGSYECKKLENLEKNATTTSPMIKTETENPISLNDENSIENDEAVTKATVRTESQEEPEISSDYQSFDIPNQDYIGSSSRTESVSMENTVVPSCPLGFAYNTKNRRCECQDGSKLDPRTGNCRETTSTPTVSPTISYPESEACPEGYKRDRLTGECVDIDECVEGPGCQENERCGNLLGSYSCSALCRPGWKFDTSTKSCVDVDECSLGQHNCPQGTHNCVNTNGTYVCEKLADCAKGYRRIYSGKCVDVDECTEGPGCREHERCRNLPGTFDCSPLCSSGWHFDPLTKGCLDVNECLLGRHNCPQGTHRCVNLNGTYECKLIPPCTSGFRKLFNGSCIDIDECAENLHDCRLSFHRYCVNREGTYECVTRYPECAKGFEYSLRSRTCEDIDECARGDYRCDSRYAEKCVNLPGSYKCERPPLAGQLPRQRPACPSGFRYDAARRHCSDVDECAEGLHSCGNEVCYNQPGGYTCARAPKPIPARIPRPVIAEAPSPVQRCQPGSKYVRNRGCVDIDECQEDVEACTSNEECINTPGSFTCQCKIGFRRDELTQACVDINECQLPENDCLSTQRCDNTVGSYNCVRHLPCGTGYTLNAATEICEDDDECILGTHDCSGGYHCRNTLGSYRCDRNPRIPQGPRVAASTTRFLAATTTPKTVVTSGPRNVCPRGFTHGPNGQCLDIDECLRNPNPCSRSLQKCVNTPGSFRCVSRLRCGDGYAMDESGSHCVDVDECADGSHECGPGQTCQNRQGGYLCECPPGHALGPDKQCIDIDECSIYASQRFANICGQNSRCENTVGSYRCICDPGFENVAVGGHGAGVCKDVDECVKTPGLCQHNCLNAWGSYRCSCNPGFRLNPDNRSCTDIDECTEFKQNNLCIGICENTPGSYACRCPAGYKLGVDERTCQDIDECASGRACRDPNEMCQNTRGSFRCNKIDCPAGYYRDRERMNRCLRTSRYCPAGDLNCFRAPMHYSYNFITFVSMIPIPSSGQLELFTMRSTHPPGSTVQFNMALVDVRGPPGVVRATESCFALKHPAPSQAVLVLTESISGPQEIELDLSMEIYHDTAFAGSAVAKLLIFVSEYEY